MTDTNGNVSYSVKELLAKVEGKLDTIIIALNTKADRDDLKQLEGKVELLQTRVDQSGAVTRAWRWAVPVLLSAVAIAVALILHYNG